MLPENKSVPASNKKKNILNFKLQTKVIPKYWIIDKTVMII